MEQCEKAAGQTAWRFGVQDLNRNHGKGVLDVEV